MKPLFAILIPCLAGAAYVMAACSDDDPDGVPSSSLPGDDASASSSSGSTPNGRPSGALLRVFNAYTPLNGEPGAIDLHAEPYVLEGAAPKESVPYGTMSKLYDPTVKDEDGNMFFSAYWAGTVGNGSALINKTETLKGGEVITYFVTTAPSVQESGRRYGGIHAYFHQPPPGGLAVDVPAGKGLLTVDTIGLDQVLTAPESYSLYFGTGSGCQKAIGDTEFTTTGVGPGSSASYALDPGSYTGAIYNDPAECTANPIVQNVPFEITAGGRVVLFVYAPKDKEYRSIVVPLEPKTP